jgi:flagellar hook-associated protein 3 FlgL
MRVADKMSYDQVNRAIAKNRTEMASLQNQAATQKRVNKPSDDPVSASRVLGSQIELRGSEQYIKNLNYARSFLDFTEQSLDELTEVFVRAKELALSQANDASASEQTRKVVAEEVKQLLNQTVQIANRKLGERFIFGGFQTTESPFDENGNYNGDMGEMRIHIDKDTFLAMNLPGSVIFQGDGLSKDGFTLRNMQQPKNLKDLAAQKSERPDAYAGAENLDDKTKSSATTNSADPNLKSSADLRAPASVRVTENAAEPFETSGGVELIEEGVDLFQSLRKLQIALSTDDKMGVQESLDRIDDAIQQIVVARTALGSRVTTIDSTLNSLHTNIVDTKTNISQLEDADAFQVISDINKTESALQATLQTSGKLMQKSLMDFIS